MGYYGIWSTSGQYTSYWNASLVITGRNEVLAKVMFLHVSVILLTGGVAAFGGGACLGGGGVPALGGPAWRGGLPGGGVPAWGGCLPGGMPAWRGGCLPWGGVCLGGVPAWRRGHLTRHPPPNTVNARPVRILLECILVFVVFFQNVGVQTVAVSSTTLDVVHTVSTGLTALVPSIVQRTNTKAAAATALEERSTRIRVRVG